MDLTKERIVITGGAGFLGGCLHAELVRRGVAEADILVPRSRDYDLTQSGDVARKRAGIGVPMAGRAGLARWRGQASRDQDGTANPAGIERIYVV